MRVWYFKNLVSSKRSEHRETCLIYLGLLTYLVTSQLQGVGREFVAFFVEQGRHNDSPKGLSPSVTLVIDIS